jgi:hypothetical protein
LYFFVWNNIKLPCSVELIGNVEIDVAAELDHIIVAALLLLGGGRCRLCLFWTLRCGLAPATPNDEIKEKLFMRC